MTLMTFDDLDEYKSNPASKKEKESKSQERSKKV
jgi:hypothetical protein